MLIVLINCHTTARLHISSSLSSPPFLSPLFPFPSLNCRRTNWSRDCYRLFDLCYLWQQLAPVMSTFLFDWVVRDVYSCVRMHARACLSEYSTHTYMHTHTYIHIHSYTTVIHKCLCSRVRTDRRTVPRHLLRIDRYSIATHYDTLQHTATHCNALQHTPTPSNTFSTWT